MSRQKLLLLLVGSALIGGMLGSLPLQAAPVRMSAFGGNWIFYKPTDSFDLVSSTRSGLACGEISGFQPKEDPEPGACSGQRGPIPPNRRIRDSRNGNLVGAHTRSAGIGDDNGEILASMEVSAFAVSNDSDTRVQAFAEFGYQIVFANSSNVASQLIIEPGPFGAGLFGAAGLFGSEPTTDFFAGSYKFEIGTDLTGNLFSLELIVENPKRPIIDLTLSKFVNTLPGWDERSILMNALRPALIITGSDTNLGEGDNFVFPDILIEVPAGGFITVTTFNAVTAVVAVPEPSTLLLFSTGLALLGLTVRRSRLAGRGTA